MFALISTEELEAAKPNHASSSLRTVTMILHIKRFVVGIDRSRMQLFDADESEQTLSDDTPVFEKSDVHDKMSKFKDFKL